MFRTEVVKSRNLRKTAFYKIYNTLAIILFIFILTLTLKVFPPESVVFKFVQENYHSLVQPVIMGVALLLIIASIYTKNAVRTPMRVGSIEIDNDEFKFLIDDQIEETIQIKNITSINFEYFSFRMRGNPMGCMNYLALHTKNDEEKIYEIIIANSMVKAEFGSILNEINKKTPVKITYTYFLKKIFKDNDFKFEK